MNEYNHICVNSYCAFMAINLFGKKNITEKATTTTKTLHKITKRKQNKNKWKADSILLSNWFRIINNTLNVISCKQFRSANLYSIRSDLLYSKCSFTLENCILPNRHFENRHSHILFVYSHRYCIQGGYL